MIQRRFFVPFVIACVALSASAVRSPQQATDGSVRLPVEIDRDLVAPHAQDAAKAAPWQSFTQRHGAWEAIWNGWTGSPKRAFGEAVPLGGRIDDAGTAHRAALEFLRRESALTKVTANIELAERSTVKAGRVWYAHFKQLYQGLEVLQTDVTARLDENGNLMAFGSEIRHDITLDATPLVPVELAQVRAREGLQFDVNQDRVSAGETLFVLPVERDGGTDYHLVRHVRVEQLEPPHLWESFVDAHDGEIVWRFDRVRYGSISGYVSGEIKASVPSDPVIVSNLEGVRVNFGPSFTNSNAAGNYVLGSVSGTGTLSALVAGTYARVFRQDAASGSFSLAGVNADANPTGVHVDLVTNPHPTETHAYYHTVFVHDYIKGIDSGFTAIDVQMPANINIVDPQGIFCNAFWNGSSINFYRAGNGCNNMVYTSDVLYHEYGHGINDLLYQQLGALFGMQNGALHEGLADVTANMMQDDPVLGQEFFVGNPNGIRTSDNTKSYPEDQTGEVHADGEIIAGAFWDLRESVGVAVAEELAHFAKYGLPDGSDLLTAFRAYFTETLVADDDNGNLGDQTPHWNEIVAAFNAHGIGPSLYLTISHGGTSDVAAGVNPIAITASVASSSGLFPVDTGSVELVYSVDGGTDVVLPMTNTVLSTFSASIPNPGNGHLIRYYIGGAAQGGNALTNPSNALAVRHEFVVGSKVPVASDAFEAPSGWSVNDGTDTATTGIWLRADPVGTQSGGIAVQPELDHSSPGTLCWVTGNNHTSSEDLGGDDVDGGKTTLLSPIYDLSATYRPVVRYWRWYTNAAGASPGSDVWQVDISNDGGASWVPLEATTLSIAGWTRHSFLVENHVTPTNNVRLRFIASDADPGSVVEAAVDDLEIVAFDDATDADELPQRPQSYALAQNSPNPFNPSTRIHFELPRPGHVDLRVYDIAGRLVRTLVDGMLSADRHDVDWNGRDEAGRTVASGVYVYRIVADRFTQTKRMVLVK